MGNYTADQVQECAVMAEQNWPGSHIAGMLRAYAATLRQQAGRVDEGWSYCPECGSDELRHQEGDHKQCARCGQEYFADVDYTDVVRLHLSRRSALAQNTQGETVADGPSDSDVERACHRYYSAGFAVALPRPEAMRAALTSYHEHLHAERARVPEGMVLVPREPTPEMAASFGYMATRGFHACYESMLSAAPSQRAEVK